MSCRHSLANGTCTVCYPATGTYEPDGPGDSMDGPGAVPATPEETIAKLEARIAAFESPPVVPEEWEVDEDNGVWTLWWLGGSLGGQEVARFDHEGWLRTLDGKAAVAPWAALVALEYANRTNKRPSHAADAGYKP